MVFPWKNVEIKNGALVPPPDFGIKNSKLVNL